jgi:hypothetical protein
MRLKTAGALIITAFVMAVSPTLALQSSPSNPPTEVTIFRPSLASIGGEQQGNCWTDSIAVRRSGAWRCMRGNMIYDPCFEVRGRTKQVICDANPVSHKSGFTLILEKPLPSRPRDNAAPRPWLLELANGSVCEAATGTMAVIQGEPVRYPCSSQSPDELNGLKLNCGLLDRLHPAKVWRADKVCFTAAPSENGAPFQLQKRETVVIRRIWE